MIPQKITRVLIMVLLLIPAMASPAVGNDAESVVDRLHLVLLDAMRRADELGYPGRLREIGPVIDQVFDFETIARIVVGRTWRQLDGQQRARFLNTFSELSKATYAARFDGFSGQVFEIVSSETRDRGGIAVKTRLVGSDGDAVSLNYLLHQRDGRWRIINVVADGVSDLSLKRADYHAVLKTQGFEPLLTKLQEKVNRYTAEGG